MIGSIGSSISQVMWLCASFMLREAAERNVSSVVPMNSIGSRMSSSLPIATKRTSSISAMPVDNCALSLNARRVSSSEVMPTSPAAAILPLTIAPRVAGVASSGSSDCRSRSPAVTSMIR